MKWNKFPEDGYPTTNIVVLAIIEEWKDAHYYDCILFDGDEFRTDP